MNKGVPVLIILCTVAAYCNSFHGPFIFDDIDAIHAIEGRLQPNTRTTLSGRPVLEATMRLNFALGGENVGIFHLTNLAIHVANALLLFGILRRTLKADGLAACIAILWAVHPLTTESVTYIVQRAESLMAFFYLLVIYCLIRNWRWQGVLACALGMVTKESMATAPIAALLFDRTFLAGSFRDALRSRRFFYLCLFSTWIVLAVILTGMPRGDVVTFHGKVTSLDYARTQLGAIAHYLRLTFWPAGQVFDDASWPAARHFRDISIAGWLVALAVPISFYACWRKTWFGFLAAWFFIMLAPSSSFVPIISEPVAEQRMYLPLIVPIALVLISLSKIISQREIIPITAALAVALGSATFMRNRQYASAVSIWSDTVWKRPDNARAHYNRGYSLLMDQQFSQATDEFALAVHYDPTYRSTVLASAPDFQQSTDPAAYQDFISRIENQR